MNWIIVSWIFVGILTAINIFVFIKLKKASEQMMKMAFPNAKNMNEALSQMQNMMGGMGGMRGGKPGQGMPDMSALMGQMNNPNMQAQMKKAMDMLAQMQKNQKR
jgi:hypothetical protein